MIGLPKLKKLTAQQELFCQEYLKDLNATQAAIRAGYSAKSAKPVSSRLLTNANLSAHLAKLLDKKMKKVELDSDLILRELINIAKSDLRLIFDDKGALLPASQWPDNMAQAVASVEVEEIWEGYGAERAVVGQKKKVKLWDKPKALELLGKHLKLFTEKLEHSGANGAPIQVTQETQEQYEMRKSRVALLTKKLVSLDE